jgi:hypothetical protein
MHARQMLLQLSTNNEQNKIFGRPAEYISPMPADLAAPARLKCWEHQCNQMATLCSDNQLANPQTISTAAAAAAEIPRHLGRRWFLATYDVKPIAYCMILFFNGPAELISPMPADLAAPASPN